MVDEEIQINEVESTVETPKFDIDEVVPVGVKKRSWVLYGLLILVVFLFVTSGVFAASYFGFITIPGKPTLGVGPMSSMSPTPIASPQTSPQASLNSNLSIVTTDNITWLSEPELIASINLTKPQEELPEEYNYYLTNKAEYKVVGTMNNGTKIISMFISCESMMCDLNVYCLTNADRSECLTTGLDEYSLKTVPALLKSDVAFGSVEIKGITLPETIVVKNVTLALGNRFGGKISDISNTEFFEETDYGKIYRGLAPLLESTDLVARNFYLVLADGSVFSYKYNNLPYNESTSKRLTPIWTNGVSSDDSMTQSLSGGCGLSMIGSVPIYRGSLTDIVPVAKSENGDVLYQSKESTNSTLDNALYQFYNQGRDANVSDTLTYDQFLNKDDVYVLWKDTLGDWQVFISDAYAPMVECGKPVIYLYPEYKTQVSIEVGAVIRKSIPTYPMGGWKVIAEPSGSLTYNQQKYPYLFWEGKGYGSYPNYQNQGVIVTQTQIIPTLYQQMTLLGLTDKEQTDFMEFWQSKLPKDPYVRLTWLGTREMNELAPLVIFPKPDTMIRVFLEFEGFDRKVVLEPQKLSATPRMGFTLVEWGGLLYGDSD